MSTKFSILPLFIIALLNEISYQMVIPAMNHVVNLTLPHAASVIKNTLYGGGVAAFTVAVMLGSPLVGWLSDQFGRKSVLFACLLLNLVCALLFIFSLYFHAIVYFLIARFLSGIAGASTAIVQAAIADNSELHQRSKHFSTIGFALTVGLIIGPLIGGYFVKGSSVNALTLSISFILIGILCLLNIGLFLWLFHETSHQQSDYQALKIQRTYGKTAKLLIVFFLLEFSWSLYFLVLPTFLGQTFAYDSQHISLFMSSAGIAMCGGLIAYRFVHSYLNNLNITKLFLGLFIISLLFILIIKNLVLNWILLIPITWSVAISYVAVMGLLSESVRNEHQGTLMGTILTAMALAWTITGFGAKFLFALSPLLPFVIAIAGLCAAMGVCYKK